MTISVSAYTQSNNLNHREHCQRRKCRKSEMEIRETDNQNPSDLFWAKSRFPHTTRPRRWFAAFSWAFFVLRVSGPSIRPGQLGRSQWPAPRKLSRIFPILRRSRRVSPDEECSRRPCTCCLLVPWPWVRSRKQQHPRRIHGLFRPLVSSASHFDSTANCPSCNEGRWWHCSRSPSMARPVVRTAVVYPVEFLRCFWLGTRMHPLWVMF